MRHVLNMTHTVLLNSYLWILSLFPVVFGMAVSRANSGYNTTFSVGDSASPLGYVQLLETATIMVSGPSIPAIEVTHLLSPNATGEYVPGIIDPGTLDITGNWVGDATQLDILTTAKAQTVFAFKIVAPCDNRTKSATITGLGFWKDGPKIDLAVNKGTNFTASIKVTGTITIAVA